MNKPRKATPNEHGVTHVTLAGENIFEVLGFDAGEASDLRFRSDMMLTLRDYFEDQKWDQATIGKKLGIPQPRVSELVNGKINKVSSDKLIGYLGKVGFWLRPSYVAATPKKPGRFACVVQPRVPSPQA